MMGHKDWTMIARIYGRWMPAADSSAGLRAVTAFLRSEDLMLTSKQA